MSRATEAQIAAALAVWPNDTEARLAAIAQPVGWKLVPEDLLSHIGDWRTACQIAFHYSGAPTPRRDDRTYWAHRLITLDRIERLLAASPINPVPAGVGVKLLEWSDWPGTSGDCRAVTPWGIYNIQNMGSSWYTNHNTMGLGSSDSLDRAKAMAQTDLDTKVRSLILRQTPDAEQGESSEGARRNETTTKGASR